MFSSVLVANRGEIACRVLATLRSQGIRGVAVFTAPDDGARHVREADVAVGLGGGARGYLDVETMVAAAVATGAEAIHPGYGFLSENPALAAACASAGIVFVGPPAAAIEAMGDKVAAKRLVAAHGVPVLPGTLEPMDDARLLAAAADVGFPLLVKPAAGGGGKGMTVVSSADELPEALASARRVAASAFGDDSLLLERLVERPRHIEVQVLADTFGNVVHLGERECTLQRRHQKIIEEAPSAVLDEAARSRLGEAACEVARAVGYVGAGTVEFLVPAADPHDFAFIEMNTRLQVEHPVTEMVTGIDLVAAQLRVAAGEKLWFSQSDVHLEGHAVEARVYAESPERGFLPSAGRIELFEDAGVAGGPDAAPLRLDAGIATGDVVSGDYDPMLAKAVAHGSDRAQALARLDGLLARTAVLGVETNTGFLRDLLADADVRAGRLDTGLVDRFVASPVELSGPGTHREVPQPDTLMAQAAADLILAEEAADATVPGVADPWAMDGWRLNGPAAPRTVTLRDTSGTLHELSGSGTRRQVPGPDSSRGPEHSSGPRVTQPVTAMRVPRTVPGEPDTVWVVMEGRTARFEVLTRAELAAHQRRERAQRAAAQTADGTAAVGPTEIRAQMPGTVTATHDAGPVTPGAAVVVVEAMKMEHPLTAPAAGTLRVLVRPGDQVRLDQVVAVVEPEGAS